MKRYDMDIDYTDGGDPYPYVLPEQRDSGDWVYFSDVQEELATAWDRGWLVGEYHDDDSNPYRKQENV
jgi:hypothetical protein